MTRLFTVIVLMNFDWMKTDQWYVQKIRKKEKKTRVKMLEDKFYRPIVPKFLTRSDKENEYKEYEVSQNVKNLKKLIVSNHAKKNEEKINLDYLINKEIF